VTVRTRAFAAFAAGWLLVSATAAAQGVEWWRREDLQRQLRLTPGQIDTLDTLSRSTLQKRRALRAALDREERALEEAIAQDDEEAALARIPMVEAARAARNKERTLLLLRIYRVLTPEQRRALARQRAGRGARPPSAR
jgi:Spy/CpxP family protein refolding chaperone